MKRNTVDENRKIKVNFDIPMLNVLLKYAMCETLPVAKLTVLDNFLEEVDILKYQYSEDIYIRLKLLKTITEAIVRDKIVDHDLLMTTILEKNIVPVDVLENILPKRTELTVAEQEKISNAISDRYRYLTISRYSPEIISILENIEGSSYETSYVELVDKLKSIMEKMLVEIQTAEASQGLMREFNFSNELFVELINKVVTRAKSPTSILQTGIRQLNAILSPGFQAGRLYTILGGSGKFKSGTLLNIADQIRKFNPQIIPYENGRRKTILFISMENSIEETLERLYDMYSGLDDDIRDKTVEEVIETLRKEGKFEFTADSGIDIDFRYFGNLEINTSRIYTLISELRDRGKEPICIVLDYIKRIDSEHDNYGDERVRLSYVGKELKNIAQFFQIPLITAMQLNREGNSIIDAAMSNNKEDVARFVGASNIGNCWDIYEDSDWVAVINLELQKSTNKLFLTWKRLKIRGKQDKSKVDYFNHPFVNEKNIRLETDVDKDCVLSVMSLASDLVSIEEQEEDSLNKPKRNSIQSIRNNKSSRVINTVKSISLNGMLN